MNRKPGGLSAKFVLFISSSIVVFIAATFLITRDVLEKFALASANELASTILDQTDKRLGQFFTELRYLAEGLAGTAIVKKADREGMRDLFLSTVRSRGHYLRGVYLGTVEGRMFEWGSGEGFVNNEPSFPPGYDPRLRPWYARAVAEGGFSVSAPYRFASVDALGITCVLPVKNDEGRFVGVLGLDILLEDLGGILVGLDIPMGGKAILLSPAGEVIASQYEADRTGKLALEPLKLSGAERIFSEPDGSFTARVEDREMHFVHKKVEGSDWIIAIAMPLESILAAMHSLLRLITAIDLLLMILLILALAAITGRLIVAPLRQIVSVVNRVEAGERGARVVMLPEDEFGLLGGELNRLLDAVDGHSRDLEGKVRARTEEIGRLQRENTQFWIAEERKRIYRDMHDSIGAKLTNIFFSNGVARELAKEGPSDLREMHERIEANCMQAIKSLKDIILGMKKDDEIASDLSKILSAGIRLRLGTRGIAFECRIANRAALNDIDPESRAELEMICDELASNALKHSEASKVRLSMRMDRKGLTLRFSDNGKGFDPARAPSSVSGLQNIRYRVERLGGSLRVDTEPGKGAVFAISLPHPEARREG